MPDNNHTCPTDLGPHVGQRKACPHGCHCYFLFISHLLARVKLACQERGWGGGGGGALESRKLVNTETMTPRCSELG